MRHEVNPDPLRVRRGEGGTTPADAKPGATANGQGRRGSGLLPMRMHQDYHQDYTRITPGLQQDYYFIDGSFALSVNPKRPAKRKGP